MTPINNTSEPEKETRRPEVTATMELWARFDEWWKRQSCITLADGFRTAMKEVTHFNTKSQGKSENSTANSE